MHGTCSPIPARGSSTYPHPGQGMGHVPPSRAGDAARIPISGRGCSMCCPSHDALSLKALRTPPQWQRNKQAGSHCMIAQLHRRTDRLEIISEWNLTKIGTLFLSGSQQQSLLPNRAMSKVLSKWHQRKSAHLKGNKGKRTSGRKEFGAQTQRRAAEIRRQEWAGQSHGHLSPMRTTKAQEARGTGWSGFVGCAPATPPACARSGKARWIRARAMRGSHNGNNTCSTGTQPFRHCSSR